MTDLILEPQEMRLVEKTRLSPSRSFPGRVRGERVTRQKGISIEFSDYREYGDGDDLRHLDWNVLARLDSPIMKTYRDEEDLAVHLLIDLSPSMDFGEPAKAAQARRLAAALAYSALSGGDALFPRVLGHSSRPLGALRGRSAYPRFCEWLSRAGAGSVGLASGLKAFGSESVRTGLCLILTDGLDPEAPAALRGLAARGHEIGLALVLSPLDLDPDLEGDLRLIDCENGSAVEVTANMAAMKAYRDRLDAHIQDLKTAVVKGGGRALQASSSQSLASVIQGALIREGWLRA